MATTKRFFYEPLEHKHNMHILDYYIPWKTWQSLGVFSIININALHETHGDRLELFVMSSPHLFELCLTNAKVFFILLHLAIKKMHHVH